MVYAVLGAKKHSSELFCLGLFFIDGEITLRTIFIV